MHSLGSQLQLQITCLSIGTLTLMVMVAWRPVFVPACATFTMPQSGLMAHKLQGKLKDKLLDVRSACIWAMIDSFPILWLNK